MSETTERMCSAGGRRLPMRFVELHDAAMKAFHAQLERRGPTSEQAELAYLHAIADLWDEVTALRAALAAATAREARPLPEGLATVEALLDYIQSAGVEQPDPIRQRLHAALAAHTERVVRWCYANRPSLESRDEYLARALAARGGEGVGNG